VKNKLWIRDLQDGCCKADKFERDARLLENALNAGLSQRELDLHLEPRYLFYLGQTYFCLRNYEKSIENYKKRLENPFFEEERWFSMLMIARNYCGLKMPSEVEEWCYKAHNTRPTRVESLFTLAEFCVKETKDFQKALETLSKIKGVPKPEYDTLNIETDLYDWRVDWLYTLVEMKLRFDWPGFLEDKNVLAKSKEVLPVFLNLLNKNDKEPVSLLNLIELSDLISSDSEAECECDTSNSQIAGILRVNSDVYVLTDNAVLKNGESFWTHSFKFCILSQVENSFCPTILSRDGNCIGKVIDDNVYVGREQGIAVSELFCDFNLPAFIGGCICSLNRVETCGKNIYLLSRLVFNQYVNFLLCISSSEITLSYPIIFVSKETFTYPVSFGVENKKLLFGILEGRSKLKTCSWDFEGITWLMSLNRN
jgi:tetratricopeptide (TPR) repeat protein